jgi:hypothetical protein
MVAMEPSFFVPSSMPLKGTEKGNQAFSVSSAGNMM